MINSNWCPQRGSRNWLLWKNGEIGLDWKRLLVSLHHGVWIILSVTGLSHTTHTTTFDFLPAFAESSARTFQHRQERRPRLRHHARKSFKLLTFIMCPFHFDFVYLWITSGWIFRWMWWDTFGWRFLNLTLKTGILTKNVFRTHLFSDVS